MLSLSLPFRSPGVDKLSGPIDELGQRASAGVAGISAADGHRAVLRLAITHHQHEGNLLQLRVANPRIQLLIAIIQLGANLGAAQFFQNLAAHRLACLSLIGSTTACTGASHTGKAPV